MTSSHGLGVDNLALVGHLSNVALVAVSGVAHVLGTTIGNPVRALLGPADSSAWYLDPE